MSVQTDEYVEKRHAYVCAKQTVDKLATLIAAVGRALQFNSERFAFSNAEGSFPPKAIMSRDSQSGNGQEWPTAEQINECLAMMHSAKHEMENAYQRLSPAERDAMQPPPSMARRY
jgi:hypothetical protein